MFENKMYSLGGNFVQSSSAMIRFLGSLLISKCFNSQETFVFSSYISAVSQPSSVD